MNKSVGKLNFAVNRFVRQTGEVSLPNIEITRFFFFFNFLFRNIRKAKWRKIIFKLYLFSICLCVCLNYIHDNSRIESSRSLFWCKNFIFPKIRIEIRFWVFILASELTFEKFRKWEQTNRAIEMLSWNSV